MLEAAPRVPTITPKANTPAAARGPLDLVGINEVEEGGTIPVARRVELGRSRQKIGQSHASEGIEASGLVKCLSQAPDERFEPLVVNPTQQLQGERAAG